MTSKNGSYREYEVHIIFPSVCCNKFQWLKLKTYYTVDVYVSMQKLRFRFMQVKTLLEVIVILSMVKYFEINRSTSTPLVPPLSANSGS